MRQREKVIHCSLEKKRKRKREQRRQRRRAAINEGFQPAEEGETSWHTSQGRAALIS